MGREHLVYEYVRTQVKEGKKPTIDEVAQALAIPRSTVSWCARKLGYKNWRNFVRALGHYFSHPQGPDQLESEVRLVAQTIAESAHTTVLIDAVGDAEIGVEYVLSRFSEAGYHAEPYSLSLVQLAQKRGTTGVLIVINESGMTLLHSCLDALEAGFIVIGITASSDTPVSKLASISVVIKNNKSDVVEYQPNYFTAAVLVFLEKVLTNLEHRSHNS